MHCCRTYCLLFEEKACHRLLSFQGQLDSIYYNKKLQADIANERKILEGEGYTPEQKYTAQSTLNKLLKQEEDEKTERSRSTDNSMGAMFNAGVMEDLQKQENRPEYVYDRINGEGSYKERTSGMTAEEKQALDSQIEDALKGATSPQITYSNLDEQIYRANLNIKEIDRRMKGIDSLDQLTGSNMQVTQAEEKVSQLEEELAYYESDENKDWGWAKALAEETRTALDEAKQELYDIQTAEKSGLPMSMVFEKLSERH